MIEKAERMLEYMSLSHGVTILMVSIQILPEGLRDMETAKIIGMPTRGEHIFIAAKKFRDTWFLAGKEGQGLPFVPLEALSNASINELCNNLLRQWLYERYMVKYEYAGEPLLLPFSFTDCDHYMKPSLISVFYVRRELCEPYLRIEGEEEESGEKYDFSTAIMTYKSLGSLARALVDDAEEVL